MREEAQSESQRWMDVEEGRRRRRLEARGARQSPCRSDATRRVVWGLWGMWVVFRVHWPISSDTILQGAATTLGRQNGEGDRGRCTIFT
jgi:hypothetical protein